MLVSGMCKCYSQRYFKTSIFRTRNNGVASWSEVLGDTAVAVAVLDRLLYRSVVQDLDGDSYRPRAHPAQGEALRATISGPHQPLR